MNLHILNQSPSKSSAMQDMLNAVTPEDAIILIEDGVIASQHPEISNASTKTVIYALEADLLARGLTELADSNITIATDDDFVRLCCKYTKTISWF